MQVPSQAALIMAIDEFLERHAMKESRLARDATGEPGLISAIRGGRSPRLDTLSKLAAFMDEKDAELEMERRAEAARNAA